MINIALSNTQVDALLQESITFRNVVIALLQNQEQKSDAEILEEYRKAIRKQFSSQKIAGIKYIRQETAGNQEILAIFQKHGYDCYTPSWGQQQHQLSLAGAKTFYESCFPL